MDSDNNRRRKRNQLEDIDEEEKLNPNQQQQQQDDQASEGNIDIEQEDQENEQAYYDDEGEGEDLMANIERDQQAIPELDEYEADGLDDEGEYEQDFQARRNADDYLNERDQDNMAIQQRQATAFRNEIFQDAEEDEEIRRFQNRLRRQQFADDLYSDNEEANEETKNLDNESKFLDMEEARGKLHIWIKEPRTVKWIRRQFSKFLQKFTVEGKKYYINKLNEMIETNKASIEVSYNDLSSYQSTLALWVGDEPESILPYLNQVALEQALKIQNNYMEIQPEIIVKIKDYEAFTNLRDLRQKNLKQLLRVRGVVTRRTAVFAQLKTIYYICNNCGVKQGPYYQNNNTETKMGACPSCQKNASYSIDSEKTIYRNYQKIIIQETPGTVPPGRVPRSKEVILLGDNIDSARPGDEIDLTGIYTNRYDYSLNVKHGFPLFTTTIEANYIRRVQEINTGDFDAKDKIQFQDIQKDPQLQQKIINSIAPSIYGHEHTKIALALSMFGGVQKDIDGKHIIRGDINVLMLGDPGSGKSQLLKYVEKTFPRCIYATGKGASAVGLTAMVHKDPSTREWCLEGGALVLADKGICLIDEFDKMNEQDRTSIHEAMEQQTISISKAGIVANLQARCAVIAAANPIKGKYNSQLSFADNVDLTDPILSRFDILCVVKDTVDQELDSDLAAFVINQHIKNSAHCQTLQKNYQDLQVKEQLEGYIQTEEEKEQFQRTEQELLQIQDSLLAERQPVRKEECFDQDLLKKYINYARQYIKPQMSNIDRDKIVKFYSDLRKESNVSGGMSIAVRHLESIIRMAEASARMHLREFVQQSDVDLAIKVMLESFIQSQKHSVSKIIRKKFAHYITSQEDNLKLLDQLLNKLMREQYKLLQTLQKETNIREIKLQENQFKKEAKELGITDVDVQKLFATEDFQNKFQRINNTIIKQTKY